MDNGGFRAMLLSISNQLDGETLDNLKFLCKEYIGKKKLEKINKGIELFECLIDRAEIGPDDTELLRSLLDRVGQTALIQIIDDYERGSTANAYGLDAREREKIDSATEVIMKQVGRNWKKVGRKLGLNDTKLDSIEDKHSRDLEEQAIGLIREWMKIQRENARVEILIKALRDCGHNYTADLVEKKLQDEGL
ncbi:FAS-associated death domain protein [Misgurnus anguillicaudatus]|uniref:FAS-associated death domain protein n=1 Tax=Misgurnus anguillicaudatus TaxID=75329 RepID=UPI002434A92B|nr:protein FADD [Misgurnus anguillicaudatus]